MKAATLAFVLAIAFPLFAFGENAATWGKLVDESHRFPEEISAEAFRQELQSLVGDDTSAVLGFHPSFEIRRSAAPNALALPGHRIILTSSLLNLVDTRDELAFVIAHEIGHHFLHHSALKGHVTKAPLKHDFKTALRLEIEADMFAVRLLKANGRTTGAGLTLLRRLASYRAMQGSDWALLNPGIDARLQALAEYVRES